MSKATDWIKSQPATFTTKDTFARVNTAGGMEFWNGLDGYITVNDPKTLLDLAKWIIDTFEDK